MICHCGHDLGTPPVQPCERCGSTRIQAGVAGVTVDAHAPTFIGESNHPDGTRETTTGTTGFRSSTSTSPDGSMRHDYSGAPPRGEEDVPEVCHVLQQALAAAGITFCEGFAKPKGNEWGCDATASTEGGGKIDAQVVGVPARPLLKGLATTGTAQSQASVIELADDVCAAVASKTEYSIEVRAKLHLALAARRSPAHTTPDVVAELRQPGRRKALEAAGYREIWLVGPMVALTHRLV